MAVAAGAPARDPAQGPAREAARDAEAGAPARDAAGPLPDQHHAWELNSGWYVYVTGALAIAATVGVVSGTGTRAWVSAALLVGTAVLYLAVGRRLYREDRYGSGSAIAFSLTVAALVTVAVTLTPDTTFCLFAVAPMCFMTAGSAFGAVSVGTIMFVPAAIRLATGQVEAGTALVGIGINLVIIGFALWFGRWFERVIEESYERSLLIRQLRESRAEAARLSEETGALAERERLAREVHDTLAQGFTSIIALTQAVESELDTDPGLARRHLALMRETAAENLAEARAMVAARRPVPLGEDTLEAALERIGARLGTELGVPVTVEVQGTPRELPGDLQVCLLRTAQEALANVRKHAGADRVALTLAHTDVGTRLTVTDDGRGFDPAVPAAGNGLPGMLHRARAVGGGLDVDSRPGGGTTIRLTLPEPEEEGEAP
ncbi:MULTISPECIES: sensor histidine kinase [unclassified Nocardiopsis]|uniref:sensor histidine kinase n=1 Tax=Nocardiopsis TaxID=2013 RepID=UPI00387AA8B9